MKKDCIFAPMLNVCQTTKRKEKMKKVLFALVAVAALTFTSCCNKKAQEPVCDKPATECVTACPKKACPKAACEKAESCQMDCATCEMKDSCQKACPKKANCEKACDKPCEKKCDKPCEKKAECQKACEKACEKK